MFIDIVNSLLNCWFPTLHRPWYIQHNSQSTQFAIAGFLIVGFNNSQPSVMAPIDQCSKTLIKTKKPVRNNSACKDCEKLVQKGIICVKCNFWWHERFAKVNLKFINDDFLWSCRDCEHEEKSELIETVNSQHEII